VGFGAAGGGAGLKEPTGTFPILSSVTHLRGRGSIPQRLEHPAPKNPHPKCSNAVG